MTLFLLQGITFGFAAAAQPGVFQTYLISQSLNNGWRRTLPLTFAPLLSDIPIILLVLSVLSQLPPWLERGLRFAGGVFLLYLAYGIFKKWSKDKTGDTDLRQFHSVNVLQAALVNLLNPSPYLGWSLVMGPQFLMGWRITPAYGLALVVGFYITMIAFSIVIVMIFSLTRSLGPRIKRFLPPAAGLALLILGFYQLWMGIKI